MKVDCDKLATDDRRQFIIRRMINVFLNEQHLRHAVATFSKSGVSENVLEESTLTFGDIRIPFQHSVG